MEHGEKITVLDNGGQYTHLIATKIRKLNVYSEIAPPDVKASGLEESSGIILSGSPASVHDADKPPFNPEIFELGKPILGLCYGLHLMAYYMDGEVKLGKTREYGTATLNTKQSVLFNGLDAQENVWMSHGDTVKSLPSGFKIIGSTKDCAYAAVANEGKKLYGLQFHPEVADTPKGNEILSNFVYRVCECKPNWTTEKFIQEKADELRKEIGNKEVLLLVSGGVDSTVAAALMQKAVPGKIHAIHIDNGLMRKNESVNVGQELNNLGVDTHVIDASQDFFDALKGVVEPEEKREIIGTEFIEVSNREAERVGLTDWLLAQGTIYPDTIESGGTKHAAVIKTHHNRVQIIMEMIEKGLIVEPISDLYKVEVREVGEELGLPHENVWRHPFPGPGLGIRALCSDGKSDDLTELNKMVKDVAGRFDLDAIVLPVKSVGVKGDARSYEHPVALLGKTDWNNLEAASTALTNEVCGVNRAVWSVDPETISRVDLVKATITRERMDLLREVDWIVMNALEEEGLMKKVWQCPTVLLPVSLDGNSESIVVRPVYSKRAMTARFADLPIDFVFDTAKKIRGLGLSGVFYDVTHKPPGTIEWE